MHIAIDTETCPIEPGLPAPPLVCLQVARSGDDGARIYRYPHASARLLAVLDSAADIVGVNIAYDLVVMAAHDETLLEPIFRAASAGRFIDLSLREKLRHIRRGSLTPKALGELGLAAMAKKHLGATVEKGEDTWRLRYHELREMPVKKWPHDATSYALTDAITTLRLAEAMRPEIDERAQTRYSLAMQLMSSWGIRTDLAAVDALESALRGDFDRLQAAVLASGLVRAQGKTTPKIVKDTQAIAARVEAALGAATPRTPTGRVSIAEETLDACEDPSLQALAQYNGLQKTLGTFVPILRRGTQYPISARWRVLMETGRTSCSDPALQQLPRATGVRECFRARSGYAYIASDYEVAELRSLAQVCYTWFGESRLRDVIIAGRDPHLILAGALIGETDYDVVLARYRAGDAAVKEARQGAKAGNFGFPGGLGVDGFLAYAKGYGLTIDRARAKEIRDAWFASWPEVRPYLDKASRITSDTGTRRIKQIRSGRVRGGLRFTQAANTMFQGLTADGALAALYEVSRRAYTEPASALYGSRPVAFLHDEILIETPLYLVDEAAAELEDVMRHEMERYTPDVPAACTAHAMLVWSKSATATYDDEGCLIPWEVPCAT